MIIRTLAIAILLLASAPVQAVLPDEVLDDPVLEARARALSVNIRCLVCQNQSIDDSKAGLARDLRILVRERLTAGETDREILDYLVSRYGEFILLTPPFRLGTYLLWFSPVIGFIGGSIGLVIYFRRRRSALAETPKSEIVLDDAERDRLTRLLNEQEAAS